MDLIRKWDNDIVDTGIANPIVCSYKMLYCDICAPYITNDMCTPLLRIVPIEIRSHNYAFGVNLVKYFSFPNYIPNYIATNEFQNDRNRYKKSSWK